MESSSEGTRLKSKTDPDAVDEELALTGLFPGMAALDAGCASGAVARRMAALVGAGGRVTGADLSSARLGEARADARSQVLAGGADNLRFLQADLRALPVREGSFDYALCRLTLEYLREPLPVVRELFRVVRPGGKVVLADVDGYGAFHHPLEGERKEAVSTILALLEKSGFDVFVGRKLFSFLRACGASAIKVQVRPYHLVAGSAPEPVLRNWRYKLETLAPLGRKLLGARYDVVCAQLLDLLRDPDVLTYSTLFLAEGTRS